MAADRGGAQAAEGDAAAAAGPLCLSTDPFPDVLVLFLDFQGATPNAYYFDSVGQDLSGNRPMSVSLFADRAGSTLHIGYSTYPQVGFDPVTAGGTISTVTGTGPGQCFAPDLASCGDFTFAVVPCPSAAAAAPLREGRAQGQRN